ncbi:MAG: condensation domain-containing protein, partial [Myxococcota bacterium]
MSTPTIFGRPAPAQVPFWLLQKLDPSSAAYNISFLLRLEGDFVPKALKTAFDALIRRHTILSCRFVDIDSQPMLAQSEQPFELKAATVESEQAARNLARVDASTPFSLEEGPLLRARLLQIRADLHHLVVVVHHAIFDGWSLKVLLLELGAHYAAALDRGHRPLSPLSLQYPQWAASAQEQSHAPAMRTDLAYWRNQLADGPAALELPRDAAGPAGSMHPGDSITRTVSEDVWRPLANLARRHQATPFMALLAAKAAVLHRLTGQHDLVIGTPSASRLRPSVRPLIGLFINTLPLRIDVSEGIDFVTLLEKIRSICLDAYRHQRVPFDRLVQVL